LFRWRLRRCAITRERERVHGLVSNHIGDAAECRHSRVINGIEAFVVNIDGDVGPAVDTVGSVRVCCTRNNLGFLVAPAFLVLDRVRGGEPWKRAVDGPFLRDSKCNRLVVELVDSDGHITVRRRAVRSDLTSAHFANLGRC
jgi:hypothetical protein